MTKQYVIDFLNELLDVDRHAMQELFAQRVSCNAALADHPSVQVAAGGASGTTFIPPGEFRVGVLGLINGLVGADADGNGFVAAQYEDGRLIAFRLYEPAEAMVPIA